MGKRWKTAGCCQFYFFLKEFCRNLPTYCILADKIEQLKSDFFCKKNLSQLLLTSYFILVCLNEKYWLLLLVFLHDDDTCTVNCYFTLPVHHICTLSWLVRPTFSVFNCIHSDYGMKFFGGKQFFRFSYFSIYRSIKCFEFVDCSRCYIKSFFILLQWIRTFWTLRN